MLLGIHEITLTDPSAVRTNDERQFEQSASSPSGYGWDPQQHCLGLEDVLSLRLMLCDLTWVYGIQHESGSMVTLKTSFVAAAVSLGVISGIGIAFQGWGTASGIAIFTSEYTTAGILLNSWLTNLPQLLFSTIYFSLNVLYTLRWRFHESGTPWQFNVKGCEYRNRNTPSAAHTFCSYRTDGPYP